MSTNSSKILAIPASGGYAIGRASLIKNKLYQFNKKIPKNSINHELEKFNSCVNELIDELNEIKHSIEETNQDAVDIFETGILILQDPNLISSIQDSISNSFSAAFSVTNEFDIHIQKLLSQDNIYLRERAEDLKHIKDQIIDKLLSDDDVFDKTDDLIIITDSLSPTNVYQFKSIGVKGVIASNGGQTSHAAILTRAFDIPFIFGIENLFDLISDNDLLALDADNGRIFLNPSDEIQQEITEKMESNAIRLKNSADILNRDNKTKDGKFLKIKLNIDFPDEFERIKELNYRSVGLVRTENLIQSTKFANEDYQYQFYSNIVEIASPYPVTFRVFDIGSDKIPKGFQNKESNPALGERGVRFLFKNPNIFRAQVRALLRSSEHGPIKIMIPMVSTIEDLQESKTLINEEIEKYKQVHPEFNQNIPIGAMIETPSSLFILDEICENSDFISIGSNDLIQYLFAADRDNKNVNKYFDMFHPIVLKVINQIAIKAKEYGIPLSICGEIASKAKLTGIFALMGVNSLSVSRSQMLRVKETLTEFDTSQNFDMLEKVLKCSCSTDVLEVV